MTEEYIDDFDRIKSCNRKRVDDSIDYFLAMPIKEVEYPKGTFWSLMKKSKKKYFGISWSKFDILIIFFGGIFPMISSISSGNSELTVVYSLICLWILLLKWTETQKEDIFDEFIKISSYCSNAMRALAFMRAEYEDLYDNPATHKMKEKNENRES